MSYHDSTIMDRDDQWRHDGILATQVLGRRTATSLHVDEAQLYRLCHGETYRRIHPEKIAFEPFHSNVANVVFASPATTWMHTDLEVSTKIPSEVFPRPTGCIGEQSEASGDDIPSQALSFVEGCPNAKATIKSAPAKVAEYFDGANTHFSIESDPDEPESGQYLRLVIHTTLEPEKILDLEDAFFDDWWLEEVKRSEIELSLFYEYE